MIDISIIIVNYNVKDFIIPCINSILKNSPTNLSIEIIVIDNNSNDRSVESIKNLFPKIKLIINDKNEGFTKGVNIGSKSAIGKYLFILNPDTYLIDNSLTHLFKFMKENKKVAILGPQMISNSNNFQQSFWRKPTLLNTLLSLSHLDFINRRKNYKNELFDLPKEVESISGGAFFVRSSIFNSMEGFDTNFFWMEDIDFCIRASNLGYKIFYLPKAKIVHHKGKSSEKNWTITIYNQLMSKIKFFKKHHSSLEALIVKIAIFFISLIKIIIMLIISPINKKYLKKLNGYFLVLKNIIQA